MASSGQQVRFMYVLPGSEFPAERDGNTIYFVPENFDDPSVSGLYVGNIKIADGNTISRIAVKEVEVTGSGEVITDVAYSESTGLLSVTKGSLADLGYITEDDLPEYAIESTTADSGYASAYQLTKDGTAVGPKINIPKDLVISSGSIETVETADEPYDGAVVGDKYIDIVLNDPTEDHIYIPVNDLVDTYSSGDEYVVVNNHQISLDLAALQEAISGGEGFVTDQDLEDLKDEIADTYQAKLTAGDGIEINESAGGTTISLDPAYMIKWEVLGEEEEPEPEPQPEP